MIFLNLNHQNMKKFSTILCTIFLFAASCASIDSGGNPDWFVHQKQNDSSSFYGVAEGFTLEEATKAALVDAAARLMVTVSSESTLLSEENRMGTNEEMRRKIQQNIEKIDFTNFKVSRSEKVEQKFYVEVSIDRSGFIDDQQKKLKFIEKQVLDMDAASRGKNIISRRNALVKIVDMCNEIELKSRVLNGAGIDVNLEQKLFRIAEFKTMLSLFSDKIEFYFDIDSPVEIAKIVRSALNKEQIKIVRNHNQSDKDQVTIRVHSDKRYSQIYGSHMIKLYVDFENVVEGKVAASNSVEVSGSSSISEKESYMSALRSLEEKISKDGIMKFLGMI